MNREQYLVKQMWLRAAEIRHARSAGERHGVSPASPQPMPDSLADHYRQFHRGAEAELRSKSH